MSKGFKNIELRQDERAKTIGEIAVSRDITFMEAEKQYDNDLRARSIETLSLSMDISYKEAEKYHDSMVSMTKALIFKDALKTLEIALGK